MVEKLKQKLFEDPDGFVSWPETDLPWAGYDTGEISGLQITLMLYGCDDVYIILILPGDDGMYDVWLRYMGGHDMVHILSRRAKDPEELVRELWEHFPDYIGVM